MHSKNGNIAKMIHDKSDENIDEHFNSLKNRYQNNSESMKGSEFVWDYVHLLYCKCHKKIRIVMDYISILLIE